MEQELLLQWIDAFFTWENPQSRLILGLGLSSLIMTGFKSDYTGDMFSKIPKKYMSFIPILVGTLLGAVNGLFVPLYGFVPDMLLGGIVIGSGQITGYQTLKGFQLPGLLTTFLKTVIKAQTTLPEKTEKE